MALAEHPDLTHATDEDVARIRRAMLSIVPAEAAAGEPAAAPLPTFLRARRAAYGELRGLLRWIVTDPEWRHHVLSVDLLSGLLDLERAIELDETGEDPDWRIRAARDALLDVLDTMEREIAHGELDRAPLAAHELAVWLAPAGDQAIATLAGVDKRTVRAWRTRAPREVRGDAERVVLVAQIVFELRRSLTPGAIVRWFARPRPQLRGASPQEQLSDVERHGDVLRSLARGARGQLAA
jgi:hypothetical protein